MKPFLFFYFTLHPSVGSVSSHQVFITSSGLSRLGSDCPWNLYRVCIRHVHVLKGEFQSQSQKYLIKSAFSKILLILLPVFSVEYVYILWQLGKSVFLPRMYFIIRQAAAIWRQWLEELGGSAVDGCCSWVRSSFSIVWHREYTNRKYLTGKRNFISIVHFFHTSQCEPHLPSHPVTESSLETALMAWLTFLCFQFDVHGGECVGAPCVHRCMLSWRSVMAAALTTPAPSQGLSLNYKLTLWTRLAGQGALRACCLCCHPTMIE